MSKSQILLVALTLVAIAVLALLFGPARRYLPIERESVTAGATSQPATLPSATANATRSGAPAKDGKPEGLVESLSAALGPAQRAPAERDDGPAFDVVRVGPTGDAVIAGRAAPGATVELLGDGKPLDRAVADRSGNFVMTPSQLPSGSYALALRSTQPNRPESLSKKSVTVEVVPGRTQDTVVARQAPPKDAVASAAPTAILVKPAAPKGPGAAIAVKVDKIEAGPGGKLFVEARAAPGATVKLFLNESYLISSKAGAEGTLTFIVDGGVRPGDYRVRLEEVDAGSSAVRSRAEASFTVPRTVASANAAPIQSEAPVVSRSIQAEGTPQQTPAPDVGATPGATTPQPTAGAPTAPVAAAPTAGAETQARVASADASAKSIVVVPAIQTKIVSRGDSLWRISEQTYGSGVRYPVIFHANQQQIRNPNLIYPGQIFVLPDQSQAQSESRR